MLGDIFSGHVYTYIVLPLLVFFGRIVDVGAGTLRVILVARGIKKIAPVISFFEVMIWLLVAREVLNDLSNPILYIAYAGGFATGTYVGMKLEEKISFGKVLLRIITRNSEKIVKELKRQKFGITVEPAKGSKGNVKVILSIMDRKDLKKAVKIINDHNPNTFYDVEDVRFAHHNHLNVPPTKRRFLRVFDFQRKGK